MRRSIINTDERAIVLDLSSGATLCGEQVAGRDVAELSELIDRTMVAAGTEFAFGRYAEPRELYSNENFSTTESAETRTIHMGIDLFCAGATPVFAPLDATVEHVANNKAELDYGPLIILRHDESAGNFFSLYGHLGMDVFDRLECGQTVAAGQQIATVGHPPTNGNWPPHLHFQLITDLLDHGVNFPGVALKSQQAYWLGLSPSPAGFFPEIDSHLLEYQ
ncbi:MAG: peptidoglycan DD-metalloendopeptidase family protein [Woeseiaceae bacterium]